MTAPLTLADLRAAMRSAKACGEHARYRDPQGAEGAAAVFAPDCNACADACALAVAERVREACARIVMDFCTCGDAWTKRERHAPDAECADRADAIREWRPT